MTSLILTTNLFALGSYNGIIKKQFGAHLSSSTLDANQSALQTFPLSHYEVNDLIIFPAPNGKAFFGTKGLVSLINYNPKTGYFKYEITLSPTSRDIMSAAGTNEHYALEGKIKLPQHNSQTYIEGVIDKSNDNITIKMATNQLFQLSISQHGEIILKPSNDIPITIDVENEQPIKHIN
jgi:hypothetical protein